MAAKKPTKEQIAYGKARAGGQGAYKITAKEVKRTAKGVAKAAGLAATVVGPGKFVKAAKIAKAVKTAKNAAPTYSARDIATIAAYRRAAATPAAKRTEAQNLAMKKVSQVGKKTKVTPQVKTDVNRLVKDAKKAPKPTVRKDSARMDEPWGSQYNPKTGKNEVILPGGSKASQARMAEFKRQGFGQSGNVVRKWKKK